VFQKKESLMEIMKATNKYLLIYNFMGNSDGHDNDYNKHYSVQNNKCFCLTNVSVTKLQGNCGDSEKSLEKKL